MRKDTLAEAKSSGKYQTTPEADEGIRLANPEDILVLRLSVNSPVTIEKALPLSQENIRKIVED